MSKDKLGFRDRFAAVVVRLFGKAEDDIGFEGLYPVIEHLRDGQVIATYRGANTVTNEGKNLLLDVAFGATAKPTWYMGLIDDGAPNSSPTNADTMSSHANWHEGVGYASATRPVWTPDAAAGQNVTNSTPISFAINATANIRGAFITTNSTKAGTTGILWSAATFTTVAVINGDTLRLTYSLTANG